MAGNIQLICLCSVLVTGTYVIGFLLLLGVTFPIVQITLGTVYIHECPVAPFIPVYVMVSGIGALMMMASFALPTLLCPAAQSHTIWIVWIITLSLFFFTWLLFGSYQIYSIYPPNYDKNTTGSNSSITSINTPAPDSKFSLISANQNRLIQNQTWRIYKNLTLGNIQTWALSSTNKKTSREQLNTQAAEPYCNRTVYLFAFWTTTLVFVSVGVILITDICLYGCMKFTEKFVKYLTF